jgi:hypothetical protein
LKKVAPVAVTRLVKLAHEISKPKFDDAPFPSLLIFSSYRHSSNEQSGTSIVRATSTFISLVSVFGRDIVPKSND